MKWIQLFIYSAGAMLLMAASERFLVAMGNNQVLSLPEPVMGIPLHYAVLIVGMMEWTVAMVCLFGGPASLQLGWLAWLATDYTVYRIGLLTMHCSQQATCIGNLTDPLHLDCGVTGVVISLIPVYLLLGSYAGLIQLWESTATKNFDEFSNMSCPACGIHIKFATLNLGRKISCPQCLAGITLRKAEDVKMSCFFCRGHIEFPSHAIGKKVPCPHCKMDITLKEPA